MLTDKEVEEIREHLGKAQNPLFFFDNDVDGLTSFLILQRYIGRGKGIAIKSFPGLSKAYFRRVEELSPDYIFVLDKPMVDPDFVELANQKNLPVVHIDHHNIPKPLLIENYYNTFHSSKKTEPTAYLCYKVTGKKSDLWLGVIGSIGDGFIPEFIDEFKQEYKELIDYDYETAFDILYNTPLGKIIQILSYGLLDTTSNVVHMLKFLMKINNPYDILEENNKTKSFLDRYEFINQKVKSIVKKAEMFLDRKKKLLFFTYGGDMSLSQYVSNELFYKYPDFVIVVGYISGNYANFSLRGNNDVRQITLDSIKDIEGATGGGHEHSTGAKMTADKVEGFRENIIKNL